MSEQNINDFLEHFGVKGQKWGVRKAVRTPSSDAKRHSSSKKKHPSELDDKDLRELVNRINMERQYNKLNPSKAQKGAMAVKTILAVGATVNTVLAFSNSPAGTKLSAALSNTSVGKHLSTALKNQQIKSRVLEPLKNLG